MQEEIAARLRAFAQETALPYIKNQPPIGEHAEQICFLLVGSAATGLCHGHSDVDICLLCPDALFGALAADTPWREGRPTQVTLGGTQLHFYAAGVEAVMEKLQALDAAAWYVYQTARVMADPAQLFEPIRALTQSGALHSRRLEEALDTLTRRGRALRYVLEQEEDPIPRLRMTLEWTEHLLAWAALQDRVPFDPRKRLYTTALQGAKGESLGPPVDALLSLMGRIGSWQDKEATACFLHAMAQCMDGVF